MENRQELLSESKGELIAKLSEKYGVGKSSLYKRLEFLGISVTQKDGNCFLFSNELALLDELHAWIGSGKAMTSFVKPGQLVISEAGEVETNDGNQLSEAIPDIEYTTANEGDQIKQLVRVAQEQAAGLLMAQNILAAQFKENPDLLPEDLRSQIRATEEAVAPKSIDPKQYALNLVGKYKAA
jgi:hypothetical protein